MLNTPIKLEFSEKYDQAHAQQYLEKHQTGFARKLSHYRDQQLARRALALADEPNLVLDLPCGAGRFWSTLAEQPNRIILAADNSADMLATAIAAQPKHITEHVRTLNTSAFAINLPDNSVDSIFCMRLLHHIEKPEHRLALLKEFHRTTRDSVIISLWVDGNYKAWRRKKLEQQRLAEDPCYKSSNRFIINHATAEQEFIQAGFSIQTSLDFLPGYSMWRVYVLRKINS
ncbi:MAG: methyltransferase domain-containing protein [Pseudomonas sp.]|jgi:ubiquinone/menaquinone biosynthesis C-methylase UbiE|nr:methyltransferase domain-containing protein [Pseudomonas sp.]